MVQGGVFHHVRLIICHMTHHMSCHMTCHMMQEENEKLKQAMMAGGVQMTTTSGMSPEGRLEIELTNSLQSYFL